MDRQQDPSGDYGYDLAHEVTGRRATPGDRSPDADEERTPTAGTADQDQDLEYDEAHDF